MKKALIDPTVTNISYVFRWEPNPDPAAKQKYLPVYIQIENSARVCEVVAQEFAVAEPLFWVECADDVVADQWYYDKVSGQIIQIPPTPSPPSA